MNSYCAAEILKKYLTNNEREPMWKIEYREELMTGYAPVPPKDPNKFCEMQGFL